MNTIVKMILPAAVFVLASAGAVGTKVERDNASKKSLTTECILINNNPNDCEEREVSCTPENIAPICTADSDNKQVFRKNAAGQCSVQLYKLDDN